MWCAPDFLSTCSARVLLAASGITRSPSIRICCGTLRKRPEIDPSGRLRMAIIVANEGPSLRTILLWKVGLHGLSEDQRVFVCAEPSLLASISS